jgi:hypothetical protein
MYYLVILIEETKDYCNRRRMVSKQKQNFININTRLLKKKLAFVVKIPHLIKHTALCLNWKRKSVCDSLHVRIY